MKTVRIFVYIILALSLGFYLPWQGGSLNEKAMEDNGGPMPVWCFESAIAGSISMFFDHLHVCLTSKSKDLLIDDIIPMPTIENWTPQFYQMDSVGDALIDVGDSLLWVGLLWGLVYIPWVVIRFAIKIMKEQSCPPEAFCEHLGYEYKNSKTGETIPATPNIEVNPKDVSVGEYADYLDTGLWSIRKDRMVAPSDLIVDQLKDFLMYLGGAVYLGKDREITWVRTE